METLERTKYIRKNKKLSKEINLKEEYLTTLETQDREDLQCVDSDCSKYMTRDDDKFLKKQKEPHGKSWRRKEDSKDIEETKISNIKKVFQDDEGFKSGIDMIDIHYVGNKDDEEGITDIGGSEDGCFF